MNRESVNRLRKRRWRQLLNCFGDYGSWSNRSRTGEDGATNELQEAIHLKRSTVVTPEDRCRSRSRPGSRGHQLTGIKANKK